MSCQQFVDFFKHYCGTIVDDDDLSPVCHPSKLVKACAERRQKDGSKWLPNLYAVNEFFIKPETKAHHVSFAQWNNPDGLDIVFFITHHWGEEFAEFVQSLMLHAMNLKVDGFAGRADQDEQDKLGHEKDPATLHKFNVTTYWCCAFALNQHAIALGDKIEDNPFHKAIMHQKCRGIILNVNQTVTALFRVWCTYEVLLVRGQGKSLEICTKNGPLSSSGKRAPKRDLWVSHMNRMLQLFDIREAKATMEEDRRKIMAEVNIFKGTGVADGLSGPDALNRMVKAILSQQAVFTLIRNGDLEGVRSAIELQVDVNDEDSRGIKPLTYAVGYNITLLGREKKPGHQEVVKLLLEKKADPAFKVGAEHVIEMWEHDNRKRAIALRKVRVIKMEQARANPDEEFVHESSYLKALENHKALHKPKKIDEPSEGLNLCYAPTRLHTKQAEEFVNELVRDNADARTVLKAALESQGAQKTVFDPPENDPKQTTLLVCMSDFEPDDIMAVAQLWELHKPTEAGGHSGPPVVAFLPGKRDTPRIFELKRLVAALTLGITKFQVLVPVDALKLGIKADNTRAMKYLKRRQEEIKEMCDRLIRFDGEGKTVSLYIMGPCGNGVADMVEYLEKHSPCWPMKAQWRMRLYSGNYNMKGMGPGDIDAIRKLTKYSKEPMIDMAKFVFFGGEKNHQCTSNFTTFALPSFAQMLNINAPLLAAALKVNSELFHTKLIEPSPSLFRCKAEFQEKLSEEEIVTFKNIGTLYDPENYLKVREYALALVHNKVLWKKVAGHKKSTLAAVAYDADDAPLCDQLLFLYEWYNFKGEQTQREGVFKKDIGKWEIDKAKGFSQVVSQSSEEAAGGYDEIDHIRAIQPYMEDPFDEDSLDHMRERLQEYILEHLRQLYDADYVAKTASE